MTDKELFAKKAAERICELVNDCQYGTRNTDADEIADIIKEAYAAALREREQHQFAKGRLVQFERMKKDRPIDPVYWDGHEEREIRAMLAEPATQPTPQPSTEKENTMTGLSLHVADDGTWLTFSPKNGKSASLHLETLVQTKGPIVGSAITAWIAEQRESQPSTGRNHKPWCLVGTPLQRGVCPNTDDGRCPVCGESHPESGQ